VTLPDWAIIGGIVVTVVGSIVQAFKVRPESKKMQQDGSAALMNSAGSMITAVREEMLDLRQEVSSLRSWRSRVERNGRAHSRWDDTVVRQLSEAGITVPEPPPLFDDSL
jgi:1,2-phenylacetyl-CoA epoxidase catalytic subunit